jgi:hypothetical protein
MSRIGSPLRPAGIALRGGRITPPAGMALALSSWLRAKTVRSIFSCPRSVPALRVAFSPQIPPPPQPPTNGPDPPPVGGPPKYPAHPTRLHRPVSPRRCCSPTPPWSDHPRGAGLALHSAPVLDLPSIGVTDRPLRAEGREPGAEFGATSPVSLRGVEVARLLRTRPGARPVVVHSGWRTDLDTAIAVVRASTRRARTPEPLRRARELARYARAAGPERAAHRASA